MAWCTGEGDGACLICFVSVCSALMVVLPPEPV